MMNIKYSKHFSAWVLLALLVIPPSLIRLQAQSKARREKDGEKQATLPIKLKVGDIAPDFTLLAFDGKDLKKVSLRDYRGQKNVALAFFVFAFTGGWAQEMKAFQQNLVKLEGADTQVLGVSMDSPFSNFAFAQQNGITFPVLGDWGGPVTRSYGLTEKFEIEGVPMESARRATFLIDKSGLIIHEQVGDAAVDPSKTVEACERHKLKN
jgi:peroxiredoxin